MTKNPGIEEFLVARGGPFYELQQRLGLLREEAFRAGPRAMLFVFLAWGVPLLPSLVSGNAFGSPEEDPYLLALGPWARFFIAIGLFILMEKQVEERLRVHLRQFVRAPILAPQSFQPAAEAVNRALRRRDSWTAEAVRFVVAVFGTIVSTLNLLHAPASSWAVEVSAGASALTAAGWWSVLFSNLLFLFLLLRWLWRHAVWAMLLREMAGRELRLVAAHPDGHAGLGFLGQYPNAYVMYVEALGFSGQSRDLVFGVHEVLAESQVLVLAQEFRRRQVHESTVRTNLIVVTSPRFDDRLGLGKRFEPVDVQAFVAQ